MALLTIFKEHKLLLGATAILSVGSVAAACATGGASIAAIPILAGFSSSLLNSMAAANLGELANLAKKLRDSSQVLTNEDLAKAAGRVIALGIGEVAKELADQKKASVLRGLSDRTEGYWLQVPRSEEKPGDYAAIEENQLRYAFEAFTVEGKQFSTLDLPSWQKLVHWLMEQEQGHLPAGVEEYQDVMDAISKKLHEKFPFYLREVLKQDASQGGKAFSGMVLDLLRDNIAQTNQIGITQKQIIQLLQQLDTTRIRDELVGIRDEASQFREILQKQHDLTKSRLSIPQDPTSIINDKTKDFVGRKYVSDEILKFLITQPNGYFILEGDPGVGKTAILAMFAKKHSQYCLTHFNSRHESIADVKIFLENICTQLIARYGLDYVCLPENTTQGSTVLKNLLEEVSQKLEPGKKLVIVVDALDEVDLSTQTPLGSTVLYLPDTLPNNVYFIVSKRPQELPMPITEDQITFDLMQYPAESAADARQYAEQRTQSSPQIQAWVTARNSTLEEFLTELVAKSENNFMYLRYVLNDISKGRYQSEALDSLPKGLAEYYGRHWQIMGMDAEPLPIDKILTIYVLSEARELVSRRLLAQLVGVAEHTLSPMLKSWRQFLRRQPVDQDTRYTIYHASFSDFLKKQAEDSGVNLEEINRRIAENLAGGAPR